MKTIITINILLALSLAGCKKNCVTCTETHTGYVADDYCGLGADDFEASLNNNNLGQVWRCEKK